MAWDHDGAWRLAQHRGQCVLTAAPRIKYCVLCTILSACQSAAAVASRRNSVPSSSSPSSREIGSVWSIHLPRTVQVQVPKQTPDTALGSTPHATKRAGRWSGVSPIPRCYLEASAAELCIPTACWRCFDGFTCRPSKFRAGPLQVGGFVCPEQLATLADLYFRPPVQKSPRRCWCR